MTKKKLDLILNDLDKEIEPLEKKRKEFLVARLATSDFDEKNYLSGIEQKYESTIECFNKAKDIVTKHLGKK